MLLNNFNRFLGVFWLLVTKTIRRLSYKLALYLNDRPACGKYQNTRMTRAATRSRLRQENKLPRVEDLISVLDFMCLSTKKICYVLWLVT